MTSLSDQSQISSIISFKHACVIIHWLYEAMFPPLRVYECQHHVYTTSISTSTQRQGCNVVLYSPNHASDRPTAVYFPFARPHLAMQVYMTFHSQMKCNFIKGSILRPFACFASGWSAKPWNSVVSDHCRPIVNVSVTWQSCSCVIWKQYTSQTACKSFLTTWRGIILHLGEWQQCARAEWAS